MKRWYSFAESLEYKGDEPSFFDVSGKDWALLLKEHYHEILDEINQVMASGSDGIIPYFNQTLASKASDWTILVLYFWGRKNMANSRKCPKTTTLVEKIPGMTSCSFSILKPHSFIKPHHGDSNVMYRAHLTLQCDHGLPEMGMRVNQETKAWKEGEIFAFCDAYEHEVWNRTDQTRLVLIVDVLREEFAQHKKQICAEVNATLFWQLKFQKFNVIKHLPKWSRRLLMKVTAWFC